MAKANERPALDLRAGLAAFEADLPRVLRVEGVERLEGLGWSRPNQLSLIVPMYGTHGGKTDRYLLRLGFQAYRTWPPSAQFVNPGTLAYKYPADQHHVPVLTSEECHTHPGYQVNPSSPKVQLICCSVTQEFYDVLHNVEAHHLWDESNTFLTTIVAIRRAFGSHYGGASHPMDNEFAFRRRPPAKPYSPTNLNLSVPLVAVTATLDLLRRAGKRESGLFWYGPRDAAGNGTVAHVAAPRQRMSWGNYHVSPAALSEVVSKLPDGYRPLAQVHSHPGVNVEHSPYDDEMASSRKALSLVFPSYGQGTATFPAGVGIHEWQGGYWYLLDKVQAPRRLVIVQSGSVRVEDFR